MLVILFGGSGWICKIFLAWYVHVNWSSNLSALLTCSDFKAEIWKRYEIITPLTVFSFSNLLLFIFSYYFNLVITKVILDHVTWVYKKFLTKDWILLHTNVCPYSKDKYVYLLWALFSKITTIRVGEREHNILKCQK